MRQKLAANLDKMLDFVIPQQLLQKNTFLISKMIPLYETMWGHKIQ